MFTINVVSGTIKGLKLHSDKNEFLRPTKERIKKSIFDILGQKIIGKTFLDLFGGTGQVGIEAFSCGAGKVIIVETSKNQLGIIKKNVSKIKINHTIEVISSDAIKFLKNNKKTIDIAFLDPPYNNLKLLENSFNLLADSMGKEGIIITETLSSQTKQNNIKNFLLKKQYIYGSIELSVYMHKNVDCL